MIEWPAACLISVRWQFLDGPRVRMAPISVQLRHCPSHHLISLPLLLLRASAPAEVVSYSIDHILVNVVDLLMLLLPNMFVQQISGLELGLTCCTLESILQ